MTFIPGTGQALVTQKAGKLMLWNDGGAVVEVAGVPTVDYGGQGGLGDVILHPDFANNGFIYLSWAEAGNGDTRGAAVGRGKLVLEGKTARIDDPQAIWRQDPQVTGRGPSGNRPVFSPDGSPFPSRAERPKFDPAHALPQTIATPLRQTNTAP